MEKKTKISLVSVAAILVLCIALTCVFVACGEKPDAPKPAEATSFVNIDINPSIELVLDSNNKVMDVRAENADAELVIHGEPGILNVDLNSAVKKIGELSVQLGFINEDNKTINVTVAGKSDIDEEAIYNSVKSSLTTAAGKTAVVVENGISLVYEKELELIKEKYDKNKKNDAIQALDVPRYRLVRSAMLCSFGLTFTEAVELSNAQLATIVKNAETTVKTGMDKAYEEAMKQAKTAYENAKAVTLDCAYFASLGWAPIKQGYALNYVANHVTELCTKQAYDIYKVAMFDATYNESTANVIAKGLYPDNTEKQQDFINKACIDNTADKKEYSKQSMIQYVDKDFRNMTTDARQDFDTKYESILGDLEANLQKEYNFNMTAQINDFSVSMTANLGLSKEQADSILDLANKVQNGTDKFLDGLGNIFNQKSTEERFEKKIAKCEEKTRDAKETLEKSLDNEDKDKVLNTQETYKNFLEKAEDEYINASNAFKKEADSWITATKDAKLKAQQAA